MKILLNFLLVFPTGSSLSDKVHQRPAHIYNQKGQTANITCFHTIESYNRILWYKQMKDGKLQFLGYMLASGTQPEENLGVKMSGNANTNQNSTLTVENLNQDSSAVYFCASTLHSITSPCSSVHKTFPSSCLSLTAHTPEHLWFFLCLSLLRYKDVV